MTELSCGIGLSAVMLVINHNHNMCFSLFISLDIYFKMLYLFSNLERIQMLANFACLICSLIEGLLVEFLVWHTLLLHGNMLSGESVRIRVCTSERFALVRRLRGAL